RTPRTRPRARSCDDRTTRAWRCASSTAPSTRSLRAFLDRPDASVVRRATLQPREQVRALLRGHRALIRRRHQAAVDLIEHGAALAEDVAVGEQRFLWRGAARAVAAG